MKRFCIKLVLYLLPLLVILGVYVVKDPFHTLYHYDPYFSAIDSIYFDVAGDYISTENLLQSYDKYHYDSYIFGSSRSGYYTVNEWSKHIGAASCYHYIANYESLYGIEKKFELIDRNHYELKNALIIIDHQLLDVVTNGRGHLRIKHPQLSGENRLMFQGDILADYLDKQFLLPYLDFVFSGHTKPYMFRTGAFVQLRFSYNKRTNEMLVPRTDSIIAADSAAYYAQKKDVFYTRDTIQHYGKPEIGPEQLRLLNNIKSILAAHHTNYRIVISPLYDQLKLDPADRAALEQIFGKEYVFDFSGINNITADKHNYYEISHYRIPACTYILDRIYDGSVR